MPNIMLVPASQAGSMSGGSNLRGSTVADINGMVHHAMPDSIGANVASTQLTSRVWAYESSSWAQFSAGRTAFGADSLRAYTNTRSPLFLGVETDAPTIGVAVGGVAEVRVWADSLDGSGWRRIAKTRPALASSGAATVYFDFTGEAQPRRLRRFIIRAPLLASLVVRPGDIVRPFDARTQFLRVATFGDSIGYVLTRVIPAIGGIAQVLHGDGGTGYGRQGGVAIGGGTPSSNANQDFAASLTSMSGNLGFNDGTRVEGQSTARTDALIAGRPDVVMGAMGINDGWQVDPNYGWSTINAVRTVWTRLRNGLGSAVLVCVGPWSGAQRGADGLDPLQVEKRAGIRSLFLEQPGPLVFISPVDSTWVVKRADGTLVDGSTGAGPWVTGIGTVQNPTGVGNADFYVGDGTHPGGWASTTLSGEVTLPVAILPVVASSGGVANFPPAGKVSIQPATGAVAYPGQVVTYTGKGAGTLTGCTGGAGTFPAGSRVLMWDTTPGEDYYGDKVAAALCAALAVL